MRLSIRASSDFRLQHLQHARRVRVVRHDAFHPQLAQALVASVHANADESDPQVPGRLGVPYAIADVHRRRVLPARPASSFASVALTISSRAATPSPPAPRACENVPGSPSVTSPRPAAASLIRADSSHAPLAIPTRQPRERSTSSSSRTPRTAMHRPGSAPMRSRNMPKNTRCTRATSSRVGRRRSPRWQTSSVSPSSVECAYFDQSVSTPVTPRTSPHAPTRQASSTPVVAVSVPSTSKTTQGLAGMRCVSEEGGGVDWRGNAAEFGQK